MSSDSPFSPPKAVVEAAVDSKTERRILRDLVRILDDEAGRLAFIRKLAWSLFATGSFLIGLSAFFIDASDSNLSQAVVGIIGGFLVGVSSFYFTSLGQWPVLRRYLDVDRIRADHERP